MLGVGYSQKLVSLQEWAEMWLDDSNNRIRFVLIAKFQLNPLRLKIQGLRLLSTGPTHSDTLLFHEDIEIEVPDIVSSPKGATQLTIPYDHIFDMVPEPLADEEKVPMPPSDEEEHPSVTLS